MNQLGTSTTAATNGESTLHDLFALTDEQILEIEPEAQDVELSNGQPSTSGQEAPHVALASLPAGSAPTLQNQNRLDQDRGAAQNTNAEPAAQPGLAVPQEPPPWLAAQMKDPWSGEEARELWNGVQQAKSEAAAYRAAFANPEDARALKELYPGGVTEARAAAERARVLDDIDRAYFGTAGKSAEEASASRAQLAAMMMREDPAAFREMVFAGLRALEEANAAPPSGIGASLAAEIAPQAREAGRKPGATQNLHESSVTGHAPHVAAYVAFEKAANEELERSVGGAIARTIEQALPALPRDGRASTVGVQHVAPLHERLSAAVRQDVEQALKGDRQLSEQIAQILSARRFDNETRGQVVRLIDERARQIVPHAAKRALNEWTHTTLAAHRGKNVQANAASAGREVSSGSTAERRTIAPASLPANSSRRSQTSERRLEAGVTRSDGRRFDYRKLSDEQILDL